MTFELACQWAEMRPKVYYKNNKPYGMMATNIIDNIVYIAATTENIDDTFTLSMIKDIIMMYKQNKICLVIDTESKQKLIRRALSRYKFTHEIKDGIMYSKGGLND